MEKVFFKQQKLFVCLGKKRVISTWTSQAVPHLSTNHALSRLTSEFEWDPVL